MIQSVTKGLKGKRTHTLAWGTVGLAGLQAAGILPKEWHGTDLGNVVSDHIGIASLIAALVSFLRAGITTEGEKIRAAIAQATKVSGPGAMLLLCLTMALAMGGCIGQNARTHTLVPALATAAPGIFGDATNGLQYLAPGTQDTHTADITALRSAIDSKDQQAILTSYRVNWPGVKEAALAFIDHGVIAGTIGVHSGNLMRERVFQFGEDLGKLQSPGVTGAGPGTGIGQH
jgi:hypothetical protein